MLAIRSVQRGPIALFFGAVYATFGLIFGGMFLMSPFAVGSRNEVSNPLFHTLIQYGLFVLGVGTWGILLGLITAEVYNRLAMFTGGIRIEFSYPESSRAAPVEIHER